MWPVKRVTTGVKVLGNSETMPSVSQQQCSQVHSYELVASKEEAKVAKVVEKALKNSSPGRYARYGSPFLPYCNQRGRRGNPQSQRLRASVKCYACGQLGHISRFCANRPNPTP